MQLIWYAVILAGGALVAFGTFGSNIAKDRSSARDKAAIQARSTQDQADLQARFDDVEAQSARDKAALQGRFDDVQAQLVKFEALQNRNIDLLEAITAKPSEQWQSVDLNNIPPQVADFALMLFRADRGRINGKVRIRGSGKETFFSTSSNDRIPLAVPNTWDQGAGAYRTPAVLEYTITETSEADSQLSIFTAGWIDFRGKQPHL